MSCPCMSARPSSLASMMGGRPETSVDKAKVTLSCSGSDACLYVVNRFAVVVCLAYFMCLETKIVLLKFYSINFSRE